MPVIIDYVQPNICAYSAEAGSIIFPITTTSGAIFWDGEAVCTFIDLDLVRKICSNLQMAFSHSYSITLSNDKTEKQAIDYLLEVDKRFLFPTKEGRKQIIQALGIDKKYSRTFDLFLVPGIENTNSIIKVNDTHSITLVELKTTQKYLPKNPKGFFFGATENEFNLAKKLGTNYKFCFVSLHADSKSHVLLSIDELDNMIVNKRVQYQINL